MVEELVRQGMLLYTEILGDCRSCIAMSRARRDHERSIGNILSSDWLDLEIGSDVEGVGHGLDSFRQYRLAIWTPGYRRVAESLHPIFPAVGPHAFASPLITASEYQRL